MRTMGLALLFVQHNFNFILNLLMFKQSVLSAVPPILFLLLVPIKLYSLHGATAKTVSSHMRSCKAASFQFLPFEMR
jgi:hypothetical protein